MTTYSKGEKAETTDTSETQSMASSDKITEKATTVSEIPVPTDNASEEETPVLTDKSSESASETTQEFMDTTHDVIELPMIPLD